MHPTAALPPHRLRLARLPDPRPGSTAGARFVGNSWWCTGLFLRFVSVPSPWVTAPTIAPASTLNGLSFPPERAYVMIENLATFRRKKPFSDDRTTNLGARTRRQVIAGKL